MTIRVNEDHLNTFRYESRPIRPQGESSNYIRNSIATDEASGISSSELGNINDRPAEIHHLSQPPQEPEHRPERSAEQLEAEMTELITSGRLESAAIEAFYDGLSASEADTFTQIAAETLTRISNNWRSRALSEGNLSTFNDAYHSTRAQRLLEARMRDNSSSVNDNLLTSRVPPVSNFSVPTFIGGDRILSPARFNRIITTAGELFRADTNEVKAYTEKSVTLDASGLAKAAKQTLAEFNDKQLSINLKVSNAESMHHRTNNNSMQPAPEAVLTEFIKDHELDMNAASSELFVIDDQQLKNLLTKTNTSEKKVQNLLKVNYLMNQAEANLGQNSGYRRSLIRAERFDKEVMNFTFGEKIQNLKSDLITKIRDLEDKGINIIHASKARFKVSLKHKPESQFLNSNRLKVLNEAEELFDSREELKRLKKITGIIKNIDYDQTGSITEKSRKHIEKTLGFDELINIENMVKENVAQGHVRTIREASANYAKKVGSDVTKAPKYWLLKGVSNKRDDQASAAEKEAQIIALVPFYKGVQPSLTKLSEIS
jgi:hypothetical protein